jgi:hypothetical protein
VQGDINVALNSKHEARNPKQKHHAAMLLGYLRFGHFNFCHLNLFRISCFEFRIFKGAPGFFGL